MTIRLLALSAEDIREAAPVDDLIDWMRDAMRITSGGAVSLPLRRQLDLPDDLGMLGIMPGFVADEVNMAGVKLVSLVPPHRRKGSSHLGLMVLYDADGLQPISVMCGSTITAIRTSAVTAVATDILARRNSKTLLILGAGEQAIAHARALRRVREFSEFRVWNRNESTVESFAKFLRDNDGLDFRIYDDIESATYGADVVCTVTGASDPILFGPMIDKGTHVNLVGSSHAGAAEADASLVQKSAFYVDYRPSIFDQAGELLAAIDAGLVGKDHVVAELGEVISGEARGREDEATITVYKSVGVASQDIVAAQRVYDRAIDRKIGTTVEI